MAVPYTFGNATTSIPLSQLDTNFATAITIGNTAVYLGNTTTTFGNVTLTNATISSGNVTVTSAIVPTVIGGTTASSTLTLQSTSGVGTSDAISFKVGNNGATTAMTINTSGNVGIGTASPSYKLDVSGSTNPVAIRLFNSTAASGLLFTQDTSNNSFVNNQGNGYLGFATNNIERMRIDTSGNVGIGTTSPGTKLDVYGTIQTTNGNIYNSYTGGNQEIGFKPGATLGRLGELTFTPTNSASVATTLIKIRMGTTDLTSGSERAYYQLRMKNANGSDQLYHTVDTSSDIQYFSTNSLERLRIKSNGDVEVGSSNAIANSLRYFDIYNTSTTSTNDGSIIRLITADVPRTSLSTADIYKRNNGQFTISQNDTNVAAFMSFSVNGERMRIDSSGNVGIGTTNPQVPLGVTRNSGTYSPDTLFDVAWFGNGTSAGGAGVHIVSATNGKSELGFSNSTTRNAGLIGYNMSSNYMYFNTNSSERARIDSSGNLLVGTTSTLASGKLNVLGTSNVISVQCANASAAFITTNTSGTAAYSAAAFHNNGSSYSLCGSIGVSGSTTSYNTSSDYRLKNSITSLTEGLSVISALKPVTYKWNADDSYGEGFIAHELQSVIPLAVTGEKDAVDEEGNIKPQGVDYSKIVVHLVAAIQELKAELDALKGAQ